MAKFFNINSLLFLFTFSTCSIKTAVNSQQTPSHPLPPQSPGPSPTSPNLKPSSPSEPGVGAPSVADEACPRTLLPEAARVLVPDAVSPLTFVGTGTPQSCTEAALRAAVETGGIVGFKCGTEPLTIKINAVLNPKNHLTLDGAEKITIDGQGKTRIFLGNRDKNLILMNLRITGGFSSDTLGAGGIHTGWRGNLGLVNVTLDNNKTSNGAERAGGGISTHEGVAVIFKSQLKQNFGSGEGGGINNLLASLYVYNSVLESNTSNKSGGGIYSDGAAFYGTPENALRAKSQPRTLDVCGSKILNNSAKRSGGIYFYVYQDPNDNKNFDSIIISKTLIQNNKATGTHAGGLYLQGGSSATHNLVSVKQSTLANNAATSYGGGLIMSGPFSSILENVTFVGNETIGTNGQGAALFMENAKITGSHLTFVANKARHAGGGLAGLGSFQANNTLMVNNETLEPWDKNKNNCSTPFMSAGVGNFQYLAMSVTSTACHPNIANGVNPFPDGSQLTDNGGKVPTVALPANTPVANKGQRCLHHDARGNPRPENECDPGAYQRP